MDHIFKGLIAGLALSAGSAYAGYAQPAPPSGWSAGGGGAGGSFIGTKAANAPAFNTTATANVGGRSVTLNATARFAANAPRYAAAAIMLHPTVRTVATIAGWLLTAGLVYDAVTDTWSKPDPASVNYVSDGFKWCSSGFAVNGCNVTFDTRAEALDHKLNQCQIGIYTNCRLYNETTIVGDYGSSPRYSSIRSTDSPSSCPKGWYKTPAGCVLTPQPINISPEEVIEELVRHPMPADVPKHIPEHLPIDVPEISPVFIPTGDPVPNPKFDPSAPPSPSNPPYTQPGTEVRPAPVLDSPWQISLRPVDKPITDPNAPPVREPTPLPDGGGSGTGNTPQDPDKTGLCDKYPNILACQTLEPIDDDTKLPEKDIDFSFNPLPGFQGTKACPAFPNLGDSLGGRQLSWQNFCDQLSKIANLILALAWFGAAWIIFKYAR